MNAFLTKIKTFNLCKENWFAWIAVVALCGCEQGSFEVVTKEILSDSPEVWMVPDGMQVDIGGEIVSIIGTDD